MRLHVHRVKFFINPRFFFCKHDQTPLLVSPLSAALSQNSSELFCDTFGGLRAFGLLNSDSPFFSFSGLSHWVATELVGSCPLDVVLTMSDPVLHLQYVLLVEAEWCVVFKISAREGHGSWISLSLCDNAESSLHILTSHSGFLSVEVWGSLWPHSGNKSTCREKKSVAPMVMICCKDTD